QPVFINDAKSGKVLAILDTTGQVASLEGTGAQFLLTGKQVMIRKNPSETTVYDLRNVKNFHLNRDMATRWLRFSRRWAAIALYPALVLGACLFRSVQALLYAALGIPIARALGAGLSYLSLISTAIMAITPVIILRTVLSFFTAGFPFLWIVGFGVGMLYLGY